MRYFLIFAIGSLAFAASADAQGPYGQSNNYGPQTAQNALGQRNVMHRNGSSAASGYRTAARIGGASAARQGGLVKPFSGAGAGSPISPYLNLFRSEEQNAAPNYYAFVRPQLQQEEANRQQQAQLQQLQRQVQQATYTTPAASVAGGARYGDTGRYYGGWRR